MKLLLDECTPRRLKRDFAGHQVFTVDDVGLKGVKNGELLRAAVDKGFDVLITVRPQDTCSTESHTGGVGRPYSGRKTLPVSRIAVARSKSS